MTVEDFMPNFAKRKSFFDKETVDGKNQYPYDPSIAERAYNNWKQQVINPSNNEYYTIKEDGVEKTARHIINEIMRIRTVEGSEFLTTLGTLTGYDNDGNSVTVNCSQPEMYEETIFHHIKKPQGNHMIRVVDSIHEILKRYTLDFNEKNVDMLLAKQRPTGCQLSLRNARNDTGKTCDDLEMFKTKPFDYIMKDQMLSPQEIENSIKAHQVLQGEVLATNQKRAGSGSGNR